MGELFGEDEPPAEAERAPAGAVGGASRDKMLMEVEAFERRLERAGALFYAPEDFQPGAKEPAALTPANLALYRDELAAAAGTEGV